jgi:hypothetical protein
MTISFPYSSAPVRQIREIQFGVMSPEEIVSTIYAICVYQALENGWRLVFPRHELWHITAGIHMDRNMVVIYALQALTLLRKHSLWPRSSILK